MILLAETIYFYYLSLKTKFVSFEDYKKWLDETFASDNLQNDILLKLEMCTESEERTMDELYIYLFDRLVSIDYYAVVKMIASELKVKYTDNPELLKEFTDKLYDIWNLMSLPTEIAYEKPFFVLNFVGEPFWWGDRAQVIKNINWLFDYYGIQ